MYGRNLVTSALIPFGYGLACTIIYFTPLFTIVKSKLLMAALLIPKENAI